MSEKNQSSTIAIALGAVLIAAAFIYMYTSQVASLKTANSSYLQAVATEEAKKNEITALNEAKVRLQQKEELLQSNGVTTAYLNSVLPATEDMPALYIQLEGLLKSVSGLTSPTYQVSKPVADAENGAVKIPVTITASGKYQDLKNFVSNFESNIRPVTFTSIAFSQAADEKQPNAYTLTANGFVRSGSISSAYASSTPN